MDRSAGDFGEWLDGMRAVLRGEAVADVPCAGCVGCCVSSYPIPLRPGDRTALAKVPDRYLQLRRGSGARMLYREDGTCPMLESGRCAIYADRPQTCRDYDCRIYAAAGLIPDGPRPVIQDRVREWRFVFADAAAAGRAAAVRRAAEFIRANAHLFPPAARAHSATAVAVMAVKVHEVFMDDAGLVAPEARVRAVVDAARCFDMGGTPA
ncbi:MAG TPA: YkgJ family cysteine cluster protein [Steroidobacteraceae bacterium]|nr:YkgJ family cysteine cluster protein [Steroidobacteraceae bacterium]